MSRGVIQRDELVGAVLDFGSVAIDLSEYATTGLRIVTVGPSGIGKTNAGLLIAEQLAAQGWICVLVDPEGEIESMYGKAVAGVDELKVRLQKRDRQFVDRAMREMPTPRLRALGQPTIALLGAVAGLSSQQMLSGARALQDELEGRR